MPRFARPASPRLPVPADPPRPAAGVRRLRRARLIGALLAGPALTLAPLAQAQPAEPPWRFGAALVGGQKADLDGGGEASVHVGALHLNRSFDGGAAGRFELGLQHETQDWDFEGPTAFGPEAPWGRLHHTELNLDLRRPFGDRWLTTGRVALGSAAESGARRRASMTGQLGFGALRLASPSLSYGAMLLVSRDVGETRWRVFPLVDWRFAEGWRLGNAESLGGLPSLIELGYRRSERWQFALGAGARNQRYRLDDEGPTLGGIARVEQLPLYARATWTVAPGQRIDLFGGATVNGSLRLEDRQRRLLREDDLDTAGFIGIAWNGRF